MDMLKAVALALCAADMVDPAGSQVRFLNDGPLVETFLAQKTRHGVAACRALRDCLQSHAEGLPLEQYGEWRRVVEFIDASLPPIGTPACRPAATPCERGSLWNPGAAGGVDGPEDSGDEGY